MENVDWGSTNSTNEFGFPFLDHHLYELIRLYAHAVMAGAQLNDYASNGTNCFDYGLNLIQYDVDLLMIKYMYGDLKDNILNTTLFM